MPSQLTHRFWNWYERHYNFHLGITTILFTWQLVHLYWLTTHVVAHRLFGVSYFVNSPTQELLIILADYAEIPALIGATLLYLHRLHQRFSLKDISFIVLINSQWLHLFWITDEFVLDVLTGQSTVSVLPYWMAWLAIGIDYLELPVIYDTLKDSFRTARKYVRLKYSM